MNDKQLLQMLEVLGKNTRKISKAASEDKDKDTRCAKAIRNIIESTSTSTHSKSLAASAAIPSRSVNKISKISMLTQFILGNGKI